LISSAKEEQPALLKSAIKKIKLARPPETLLKKTKINNPT
jgi:hypothetical protein